MQANRIYLAISVFIWLPYGLYCLFMPSYLDGAAGVVGATPTGTTEIRAMYGGLQASIGVMCAVALMRMEIARSAMTAMAFFLSGLFVARVIGFVIDGSGSEYTHGVLVFEGLYSAITLFLLRR